MTTEREQILALASKFGICETNYVDMHSAHTDNLEAFYRAARNPLEEEIERLRIKLASDVRFTEADKFICDQAETLRQQLQVAQSELAAANARIAELEAQAVPEGWKLVPIEPTDKMTYIGQQLRSSTVNSIGAIYKAMLAVAPSPEGDT